MARTSSKTGAAATGSAAGAGSAAGGAKGAFDPRALLNAAAAKAKPVEDKKGKGAKDRTILTLSPEGVENLRVFGESKIVGDICDKSEKQSGAAVKEEALDLFTASMWSSRSVPTNPLLVAHLQDGKSVDVSAMFLVKNQFRPYKSVPGKDHQEEGRTSRDYLFDALTAGENGLADDDAERLLDNEINFEPIYNIANLTHLLLGYEDHGTFVEPTPEGQEAASKLLRLINDPGKNGRVSFDAFTDQERELLTRVDTSAVRMRESKGFLNRVLTYCRSLEQLRHVLTVIPPDLALTQVKMGENLGNTALALRRQHAAEHVLGLAPIGD